MKYVIRLNYNTGDSFGNEDGLEQDIAPIWDDIEEANAALIRIKEHYKWYESIERSYIKEKVEQPEWHKAAFGPYKRHFMTSSRIIFDVNGKPFTMSTTGWTGYFESLNFASIIPVEEDDGILDWNNIK